MKFRNILALLLVFAPVFLVLQYIGAGNDVWMILLLPLAALAIVQINRFTQNAYLIVSTLALLIPLLLMPAAIDFKMYKEPGGAWAAWVFTALSCGLGLMAAWVVYRIFRDHVEDIRAGN